MRRMRSMVKLVLVFLAASGCYNWNQVPSGVQQRTVDLPVAGMTQRYTVLLPQSSPSASATRHPAVVVLHSGFSGDETVSAELARRLVQRGLVVILPAYRGEIRRVDGKRSEGKIEFCRGEVDDAQAALRWLRSQPFVDAQRLAALGSSHGGCIALQLGQREPALRALVTFSAPVAAAPLIDHLQGHPDQTFFYNGILAAQLKSYIQASPKAQPDLYEQRSPLSGIERLRTPVLIFHGTQDHLVPLEQACWLYQALATSGRPIEERWIDPRGTLYRPAASACPQAAAVHPPSTLPTRTEFVFLEGQGHFYARQPRQTATDTAVSFLLAELRP
jgi:dipeptidyl aminopeptidase/acylaminoacyl peptidase